jgi:EpsI family protein
LNKQRRALTLGVAMCATSATSFALRPGPIDPSLPPPIVLDTAIPLSFGEWMMIPDRAVRVEDPRTVKILRDLYGQVLTRTYVDKAGYGVMLSVAYGADQRDGLTAHKPEICYPAQGFKLEWMEDGALGTPLGNIEVRRLRTSLGSGRPEPVTYWFTQGDQVVKTRFDRRIAQLKAFLTGQIPDGILFRISSIDREADHAFARQQRFVADLVPHLKPGDLKRLSGLSAAPANG